ncbi:hypothetical protein ABE504_19595 [Paenibacillus oryzisoli]|uniref:hypothetical protein n=1 Tax=Paenibacillus oryzisoli TaxID=1850517 RepID=UPI003D2C2896
MQSSNRDSRKASLLDKKQAALQGAQRFLPLLFIWGAEWIFNAVIDFAIYWRDLDWLKTAAFITALIASFVQVWSLRKSAGAAEIGDETAHPLLLIVPGLLLIAAVVFLEAIEAVSPLFAPLLRAFLLAVGFVQAGLMLGRGLIYVGLWLFALTVVMGLWYLGYSAVILEGMGGIALVVSGLMLRSGKA